MLRPFTSVLIAVLFTVPGVASGAPMKPALPLPDGVEKPLPKPLPLPKPKPFPPAEPAPIPIPYPTLDPSPAPAPPPAQACTAPANCAPGDVDRDGVPDAWEDRLAATFAPELRLPPDSEDWTRPSSVDWYLARVHMRFEHSGCSDCQVLNVGAVTQQNLAAQKHRGKNWRCSHNDSGSASTSSRKFFLQPPDDDVHKGAPASDWRAYVHVKPGAAGGWDVQYWFFYPYNDSYASANHEGDWEHITVSTDAAGQFASAYYAQHGGGATYKASDLSFVNTTHPVVYVADGSHASFPRVGNFDIPKVPLLDDHTYAGGPVWQTWLNWVNVGEVGSSRNGQSFIDYAGRWGEFGSSDLTSGPPTMSFQSAWNAL
jgi:hypothetical protein